ncbi:hypothetical protein X743_11445 [Mesorhizobium sp. LNHC252B00]|nr:hypothetical protein X743_11445 [Mesorhizobium sp. LNHC252B00]
MRSSYEIESHVFYGGEVCGGMVCSQAALVIAEDHVEFSTAQWSRMRGPIRLATRTSEVM